MSLMRITAVDYTTIHDDTERRQPVVKVVGRDTDGKRRVHHVYGTRPYCYTEPGALDGDEEYVIETEAGFNAVDPRPRYNGIELKRHICKVPDDVNRIKEKVPETWEADIPFYRRASIDYDLSGYVDMPDSRKVQIHEVDTDPDVDAGTVIEPRVVYGDIEVMMSEDSVETMLDKADQKVTAITLYDNYEDAYDIYVLNPDDGVGFDTDDCRSHLTDNGLDPDENDITIHFAPTEVDLLDSFIGYFENVRPDMTTGWNWVKFDMQYLLKRIQQLEADDNNLNTHRLSDAGGTRRNISGYHGDIARAVTGVPAIDLMKLFFERIEFSKWRSKSLEYVSQKLVGHGKISDINVNDGFENDRAKLAAYNAVDVLLCVEIDEARDVVETCMGLAEESQVQIYDVFSEMRLVDGFIMARSDDDEILPNQSESDVPENDGGLVLSPSQGIQSWVGVMDLKSLYPSCMITWNISPETVRWLDGDGVPDMAVPWVTPSKDIQYPVDESDISWDRLGTTLEYEGIVPKYLKLLFENREDAKAERAKHKDGSLEYDTWDRKQYGLKVLMNSFYGVSSNDYWRLAKDGLGDAITSAARYSLYAGKEAIENAGYDVIYGDTDSCFFSLERDDPPSSDEVYRKKAVLDGKGLTSQVNGQMEAAIRKSGLEGDHPYLDGTLPHDKGSHCIHYEFEKLYRRYIQFGKKKRYAGLIVWKEGKVVDKIDVTGFESQRSDTPELAAEAQETVLHMVLDGDGFEGVSDYVSGLVDDIRAGTIDLVNIARPKSLAQAKDEYANPNAQVLRACRASEEQMGKSWVKGDDPFLVYLKRTPPGVPSVSVIALEWNDELPDDYEVDADEHTRICLEAPLAPILDEVGWAWHEVKNGVQAGDAMDGDWGSSAEEVETALPERTQKSQDGGGGVHSGNTAGDESDEKEAGSTPSSRDAMDADW